MTEPSLTTWNRLEPRPRTDSIARALQAQVRDPLWFLTRQWQFGEFQGEDAASPAWIQFRARFAKIDGWGPTDSVPLDFSPAAAPLEATVENESVGADNATAVELGQRFEALLSRVFEDAGAAPATLRDVVEAFRRAYPMDAPAVDSPDRQTYWFLRVCAGRAIDGARLYDATRNTDVPADPALADDALRDLVRQAVQRWRVWVRDVLGDLSRSDASTWRPDRLEYGVDIRATTPGGGRATFDARPGREGAFDWYAFDEKSSTGAGDRPVREVSRSLLPIGVRFRGMPHARWWQFQDRIADLGEVQPELRELAKLVLMDFMFVHGNDWFVVPFTQDVGTLCRVDRLVVHDVFGGKTLIERADRQEIDAVTETRPWAMFATTAAQAEGKLADYFILPPSAGSATLNGETLESVRFIRDEMANMVWAIEHTTENGIGMPWPGQERTRAPRPAPLPVGVSGAPLRYRIQSDLPRHWIPFVPVRIADAQVALERAAMLGPAGDPIRSVGRVLSPPDPYRVREEEVPRAGVTVSRVARRSRWIDGSTHLWIARRRRAGAGEGSSGLRFDVVEPTSREEG